MYSAKDLANKQEIMVVVPVVCLYGQEFEFISLKTEKKEV